MDIGVATLIGFAIKEIVLPTIFDSSSEEKAPEVDKNEITQALFESEDTLKLVSSVVDIFI